MPATTLTDARVRALKPRKTTREVRDGRLRGFGVRVSPSGARRFFIHCQHKGERIWKIVGDSGAMSVTEARATATEMLAAIRRGSEAPHAPEETLFEAVAETAFRRHERVWKPGTLAVNRCYLRNQLLPLMSYAVACGHVEASPTGSIRRNRRPALTRFLSREEVARLHDVLDGMTRDRQQADIIRLLLLTGCRRGEIVGLRWSEVQDGMLALADSKTGPRTVPLGSRARAILSRQPRGESPFVFPSPRDPARPRGPELSLWYRVRREAGIEDCRLHDLRHTVASHAVMNGVPLPVVSRLLGHSTVRMTLRYAHLADRDIEAAAERVGAGIAAVMADGP